MKQTKTLLIIGMLLLAIAGFSQVKVSSYSIYALGVSAQLNKNISTELKFFGNKEDVDDVRFELNVQYALNRSDYHQFWAGVGFSMLPFRETDIYFSAPVTLEVFPLQSFKRLSLLVEAAPLLFIDEPDVALNFRHLWGIRYCFEKKD